METPRVAIIICTKDRPDFMARQFDYLAKLSSPHPIYIADSSNTENATSLKRNITAYQDKFPITYTWYPPGPDNHGKLVEQVKEKYACVNSDDDYQIPDALTECALFLEKNPDYSSAGGHSVSFRLDQGGPYGNLKRLADYPRCSIEADPAGQRLIDFFKVIYSISFFVNRTESMRQAWKSKLYMANTMNELISWGHLAIAGKSKLIDRLSLVRQMHDRQYLISTSFDWATGKNFSDDYELFRQEMARAIVKKDKIDAEDAKESAKEAFWHYIQAMLSYDFKHYLSKKYPTQRIEKENVKTIIARHLPLAKIIYRKYLRPYWNNSRQMHYEVLQPHSRYYKDFKPVTNSFSGPPLKNL